jgi:hypothetical protein
VLAEGVVVGRIFRAVASPEGSPWMWALAFRHHEDRTPTQSQAVTGRREPVAPFFRYGRALLRFANETRVKGRAGESDIRRWPPFFIIHSSERAPWHLFAVADGPNSVWLRLLSLNFPCCHAACSSWVHLFQIFTNRAEREYVGALESSHQMGGNDVSGRLMEITSY